jgi:3',5'-cyclic AMP phosphodiesterase CpdA
MNRRSFFRTTAGLAAAFAVARSSTLVAGDEPKARFRRRVLRAAHLTDIHVTTEAANLQDPPGGMAAAIRHAQNQADKPDLLLFGGDMIMDSLGTEKTEVLAQWETWDRIFTAEVKAPHHLCLGNHDVYGWARRDPAVEADPQFGKTLALERLGMKDRYYSFDRAGWHFVVLDSMQIDYGNQQGYTARLDDAQFAWLARDLAATPATTPVCVLSHIPILSSCVFFDGDLEATGNWIVPGAWMHVDARRIKDLFRRHPQVKVCLSGHIHLVDDVTYLGVRYLCNGAVCGAWWKGRYQEFDPAYALVDFYDDGTVENRIVTYRT